MQTFEHFSSQANYLKHSMPSNAPRTVVNAIKHASAKTGVDFAYMLKQAETESSFNPRAKSKSSSATGLYQFISSTWIDVVKRHGAKHGINTNQPQSRLLALRNDPKTASLMAAEFAADNKATLERKWGGKVGPTEQYFAHFMGAGGASAFLNARDQNPMQKAAYIFPKAARANRSIFYDTQTGRAKTMDEVYAHFDAKFSTKAKQPSSIVFQDQRQDNHTAHKETVAWNDPVPNAMRTSLPESYGSPIPSRRYVFNPLDILLLSKAG